MTKDINDFITIVRQKNGRIKVTHNISNEGNIYKLLHEQGFRKTKLNNKRFYFKEEGGKLTQETFVGIKNAFKNLLEAADFSNIPTGIEYSEILNWYYKNNPIKENGLFDHYLEGSLTESEAHNFRLQTDSIYKDKFEVQNLLSKFDEWEFNKTVDLADGFCKGNPIYYKNIGENKFLLFNHSKPKKTMKDIFDCWIASFANEKQIGNIMPLEVQSIRLGFCLARDFELISMYVN